MPDSNIRGIVKEANDRWNAAFNSGDAAAVAALYTDDGLVLPHTHAIVRGPIAISDFWAGMISAGIKDHGIELLDAQDAGELAYSSGRWWASGVGEDGKPLRYQGTIVTVLRKQRNGSWKTCLHTWN